MTTESNNKTQNNSRNVNTTEVDSVNKPRQRNRNMEARGPLYIPEECKPSDRYLRWDYYNSLNHSDMQGLGYELVNVTSPIFNRLKSYASGRGWVQGSLIIYKGKDVDLALYECPLEIRAQADEEIKREVAERRRKIKPDDKTSYVTTNSDISGGITTDYK